MNGARPIEALPRYPTKYRLFGMALLCYVGSLVLLVLSQDQSSSAGYLFAAGALLIPLAVGFAYFDVKARAKLDKEVHPQEFAGRGYIGVCAALLLEVMLTPLAFLEPRDAERLFLAPGEAFVFVLAGLAVPYFLCVNQVFLMNDQIAIVKEGKLFWSGRVSDLKGIWLGARFRNVAAEALKPRRRPVSRHR